MQSKAFPCRTVRFTRLLLIAAVVLIIPSSAPAAETVRPWDGDFSWNNTGAESDYGNVNQSVELSLKSTSENVEIGIVIRWQAGATIEMGAALKLTEVVSQTDSQGTPEYVLPFAFKDPFQNKGTGKITINGQTAKLSLDATEVIDSRAARQYGDYLLQRSAAP